MIIANDHPDIVILFKEMLSSIKGLNPPMVARSKAMLMAKINRNDSGLILLSLTEEMGGISSVEELRERNPNYEIIVTYPEDGYDTNLLVRALEMGVYECVTRPDEINSREYKELRLHLLTVTGLLLSRKRFSEREKASGDYRNKFFMPQKTGAVSEPKPEIKSPERKKLEKTQPDPRKPAPVAGKKPVKKIIIPKETVSKPALKPVIPAKGLVLGKTQIIVIASSTGGPEILSRIFSILPGTLKVPILLVQHIPEGMTQFFAKSLNEKSELEIREASHGDELLPSKVYLAPGGQHMTVSVPDAGGSRQIFLNTKPAVNGVRPSADILFESVARSYEGNILAVILTGMGEDGRNGVRKMKQSGCVCITQAPQTCVVYGMPRAVDDAGLSDASLDPLTITQKIALAAG